MMILLVVALISNISSAVSAQTARAAQGGGELSGVVRRAGIRTAISGATVRLLDAGDESAAFTTMTSDEGAFRFDSLRPGAYLLEISARGFVKRRYLAHPATKRPFRIGNEKDAVHFDAELQTLPRLHGRVVDAQGAGLPGVMVWALANIVATERGLEWSHLTVSGGGGTDGDGNFTISNLLPGEYHLYAFPVQDGLSSPGLSALPHGARRVVEGYYPLARNLEESRPVTLLPGEALTDILIQLPVAPTSCAHGSITSTVPISSSPWYVGAMTESNSRATRNPIASQRLDPGAKELRLCGLPQEPLVVELYGPAPGGVAGRAQFTPRKEEPSEFSIELTGTFPLQIRTSLVGGTARWCKSSELSSAGCYDTADVRVRLQSNYTYVFLNPIATRIAPGELSLDTVFKGAYRTVVRLPRGLYVAKAQLGTQPLTPDESILLDGSVRSMDFQIAETNSQVNLELSSAKDFAGTVYLVPVGAAAQSWRQIVAVPVSPGESRVQAAGVAPGDYDVIAVDSAEPAAAIAVLRNSGSFPRVHIEVNTAVSVSLKP